MRVDKRLIVWSIIGTGISSIAVQLLTIREFITQFHGNEITISLVLFVWLLLNGVGSLAAKFLKITGIGIYTILILIIALWPLPQLIIIRYFREAFLIHGTSPGFYEIFLYIGVTTAPYCLLVGYILPSALSLLQANHYDFSSGELYITDNIGDIAGGVLFSFFLVYWLNPFKTVAVTSVLLIVIALLLSIKYRSTQLTVFSLMMIAIFFSYALNSGFEKETLEKQYGTIVKYLESPFGRIVVTKEGEQHTFWESGMPLYTDSNVIANEEKVHYAMSQIDGKPGNVLLISGGLGGTIDEINKYKPARIDYVELDPSLTKVGIEMGLLKKVPDLHIINTDGRTFLANTKEKYDVIIIDLPDPDTFQLNRFFTSEFFKITKQKLNPNGVLSFGMKYSENYLSDIERKKLSSIYNTVSQFYSHVIILPGREAYFLCRNREIHLNIPERLKSKSIKTKYAQWFFKGNITQERIAQLKEKINSKEYINTDFEPRIMNITFREWFAKYGSSPRWFILIIFAIIMVYIFSMKKEEYVLFSSGMASMGIEVLVIYCFQIMYGYIYTKIGLIVTVFLIGLLPGAAVGNSYRQKRDAELIMSEVIIICLLICFYVWLSFIRTELHQIWFIIYCFIFSFMCGFQFPIATGIIGEKTSPAAGCFAADLAGAAVGTLLAGTLLAPLEGIQAAVIFIILVKISSSMLILFKRKETVRGEY